MSQAMPDRPPPEPPSSVPAAAPLAERPMAAPSRHMLPPSRQRRAPTSGQMARRRFFVRVSKRLLPALALALLALVVFWPEIEGNEDRSRVSFRRTAQPRAEALRVVNPRYQGIDELNRPYTVTANAGQQQGSAEILDLDEPRADILLTDGGWIYLQARNGRYDKPASHLDLAGEVTIYHDNGTMLQTDQAAVEIDAGTASGDQPVAAQGPFGTLTSEGFRLADRGAVVVFTGRAHAVLEGGRE
jgi:lipopolysaccharide export system protein LptC